jgi:UDP-N-acetylglucosamine transferase subunit ALG13/SAM-dependent methyltransferase
MPGTFVTVGNAHQPFTRLLEAVHGIAADLPQPVLVQRGHTPFSSDRCTVVDFMSMDRFMVELAGAELVITHGGATVMQTIQLGKIPVVCPRLPDFGEHIDDHQLHFGSLLAQQGAVELVTRSEELRSAALNAMQRAQNRVLEEPPLLREIGSILARMAGAPCPACGNVAQHRRAVRLPACAVYRCPACTVVFSDLRPSGDELAVAYENFNAGELSRQEFELYRRHAGNMLSRLVGKGTGRRFLDYGCGGGHFVAAAHDLGFEAVGIELDRVSVSAGAARGLDIRQAKTDPAESMRGESFDVMLIFHVLEHTAAPRLLLERLLRHLKPGGTLIIGVPDQDSFPSRLKRLLRAFGVKRAEYGFVQPPIHLIGFNEQSLKVMGSALGLECAAVKQHNAIEPDAFPVGRNYWVGMPIQKAIYSLGALLGSGGHLVASFTPK